MEEKLLNTLENYSTKSTLIFNMLNEKILCGAIKPGEQLSISNISSSLGVSETPVREALKMLDAKGLVSSIPHVGTVVSKFDLQEMKDLLIVRSDLECLATKLAVPNIYTEDIEKLNIKIKEMEKYITSKDYINYGKLNREFHKIIYDNSKNQLLCELLFDLMSKSERMRSVFYLVPELMNKSHDEHIKLIELLKRKDTEEAIKIIKYQTERVLSEILKYFKNKKG